MKSNLIIKKKHRNKELIESEVRGRREKVRRIMVTGAFNTSIARDLGVDEKTIRSDKLAIKNDILQEFKGRIVEDYIIEVKIQTEAIMRQGWKIYLDSQNNENARLGALKTVLDALAHQGNLLKQLGLLRENPNINVFNQQNNVEKANIFSFIGGFPLKKSSK